ncbi:hypothetical protein KS4_26670 [Poriferisphaera corsica]|uniref:Uncharacterized protein n=1 Tax=Poriferisphaera corsica TaxID=2528020 RepID=A0A517YWJ9_9BACT|nr:hypothetical protein [Poriferisphaera corsica]QDU34596.1 hypothetical protein KS4_26670 [Poriferisphaera corsica]
MEFSLSYVYKGAFGLIPFVGIAGIAEAAPVYVETSGRITSLTSNGSTNYAPGDATVGDEAIVRFVYEVDPDNVLNLDGGARLTASSSVQAIELSINGDSYTFDLSDSGANYILQQDQTNLEGDNDRVILAWGERINPVTFAGGDRVDLEFEYPADTIEIGDDVSVPIAGLAEGIGFFTIAGEGFENTRFQIELGEVIAGQEPVVVPTPAALGAGAFLLPMLLRRRQRA